MLSQNDSNSPLSSTSTAVPPVTHPKKPFAFTPDELAKLYDPKDLSLLRKMGGVNGLVEGLHTDPINGLCPLEGMMPEHTDPTLPQLNTRTSFNPGTSFHGDHLDVPQHRTLSLHPVQTFQDRRKVFGTNRIPPKKSKNVFQLMWMVLQDKLLVCYWTSMLM